MADISPQVRAFVNDHISSVAQLEVLLLLRHAADRSWSIKDLSEEFRTDPVWLNQVLHDWCERGIVEKSDDALPAYRYRAGTPELDQAVSDLAQAYLVHRVRVTELIYSKPSGAIRAFADAFDLRKPKPNG